MPKTALITGAAGFIGFHISQRLLASGWQVIGVDGITNYYDPTLKEARLNLIQDYNHFTFYKGLIEQEGWLESLALKHKPDVIIHLAAQAGVRYSIEAPRSYVQSNLIGTHEVLEAARAAPPKHLMIASTSSAYGANRKMPYQESDTARSPLSFYAATKLATEDMAHSYAHLFDLPITMMRFFTVYGPWGRPDMALFKFTKAILNGDPIDVYNQGQMKRDFTFVDDLTAGMQRLINAAPNSESRAPFRILNLGNGQPTNLIGFIEAIEHAIGKKAQKNLLPLQDGDMIETWADTKEMEALISTLPQTSVTDGVKAFVEWYEAFYKHR